MCSWGFTGLQIVSSAMDVLRAETIFSFFVGLVEEFGLLLRRLVTIMILLQTGIQLWFGVLLG